MTCEEKAHQLTAQTYKNQTFFGGRSKISGGKMSTKYFDYQAHYQAHLRKLEQSS